MIEINDIVDLSHDDVIIDFYSISCGPCIRQREILYKYQKVHPKTRIYTCNVTANPGLVQQYAVTSLPTLVYLQHGKIKKALHGLISMERLEQEFKR